MAGTPLDDVEAFTFDVFGTVVDWHASVARELERVYVGTSGRDQSTAHDWSSFAKEWRAGYIKTTRSVSEGGEGSLNVDAMHREILDAMLASDRWAHLAKLWNHDVREKLNTIWHRLDAWPDSTGGLKALKEKSVIATLSNGNVRLLVDMAKHANLPWDVVFSASFFGSYKPNPRVYRGALEHLALASNPGKCAMVAAHIHDLLAAEKCGMKTVYVRRETEDDPLVRVAVKPRGSGAEFEADVVVDSLVELAGILK